MSLFFSGKNLLVPLIWTFAVTKKLRSAKMSDVEEHELEKTVFLGLFSSGTPISGPLLKEKAKHFSAQ